jgi:uncharacterized protein
VAWEPGKPSQNENEYFARQDEEWKRARRAELDAKRAAEAKAPKMLTCPRCGGSLAEREFHHVKVDVCKSCRGVWLDHGELELLAHVGRNELQTVIREIDTATH